VLKSVAATGDRRQTGGQKIYPGEGEEKGSFQLLSAAWATGCSSAQTCAPTHHRLAGRGLTMPSLGQAGDPERASHHEVRKAKAGREHPLKSSPGWGRTEEISPTGLVSRETLQCPGSTFTLKTNAWSLGCVTPTPACGLRGTTPPP